MLFHRRVKNLVKHVGFRAKETEFAGSFTALLYSNEFCTWNTQNSCWDIWQKCSVGGKFRHFKKMILMSKVKNTLAHRKSSKIRNWRHDFRKTHVRRKLNLQNHTTISKRLKALRVFQSKDIGWRTSWGCGTSWVNSCFNGQKGKVFTSYRDWRGKVYTLR